jgi:hypothetical protein
MGFNPLSLLLGQQISGAVDPNEYVDPGAIVVQAPQPRPEASRPSFADAPLREEVQPRYVLGDDRIAPREEELKEILPRKGMFGVKGTLRDILGTLGDAFLVQGGRDAVYRPQRQREQMGDAMFGASQDPLQAAERLAAQGFTKEAQDLIENHQLNESRAAQQASLEGSRQDQARNRQEDNLGRLVNLTARRLQAAGDNPESIAYAMELAKRDAARLGIDLADLGIQEDQMTPAQRAVIAGGDMTVNQQVQVPFTERRVRVAERGAANAERRTDIYESRPPQGPQPRATTDSERYVSIMDKPESQRTAGERAWAQRYREGTSGGSSRRGGDRRPVSPDGEDGRSRMINGRRFTIRP